MILFWFAFFVFVLFSFRFVFFLLWYEPCLKRKRGAERLVVVHRKQPSNTLSFAKKKRRPSFEVVIGISCVFFHGIFIFKAAIICLVQHSEKPLHCGVRIGFHFLVILYIGQLLCNVVSPVRRRYRELVKASARSISATRPLRKSGRICMSSWSSFFLVSPRAVSFAAVAMQI